MGMVVFKRRTTTIFIKLANCTKTYDGCICIIFYNTMHYMVHGTRKSPNNAQAGLVSVVVGAELSFGLYVNGKKSKISNIQNK